MFQEKVLRGLSGWLLLVVLIVVAVASLYMLVDAAKNGQNGIMLAWVGVLTLDSFCFAGLTVVNPNEARVVLLFGRYNGTLK